MSINRESKIPQIQAALAEAYAASTVPASRQQVLPSEQKIIRIIELSKAVLYPHHYLLAEPFCFEGDEAIQISYLLDQLQTLLAEQIYLALSFCGGESESFRKQAVDIALDCLEQLPELRRILDTDVQAAFDGDPAAKTKAEVILCYPGFSAILVYRLAHQLYRLNVPLLPRLMSEYIHGKTGIDIHPGADIGAYFFIDHGTGIVIGETCKVGEHVKIYQGVTLGALSLQDGRKLLGVRRHPSIGDRVTIYSGASLLGGDTVIGEDTVVGGNVFLTHSVDAGMLIRANLLPPKIRTGQKDFSGGDGSEPAKA